MKRIALSAAILGLTGCGPAEEQFGLALSLKAGGSMSCTTEADTSASCNDYPVSCGAVLNVRVLDDETDDEYASVCIPFGGADGDTLCDINELGIDLGQIPAENVRVQVAVWPAAVGDDCPEGPLFTLTGEPQFRGVKGPFMAFGGQAYFHAGDDALAEVELGCADPALVSECGLSPNTFVTARINDLSDMLSVSSIDAARLIVSIGEPDERDNPLSEINDWVLEPNMVFNVPRQGGALWTGQIATTFEENACLQVLEDVGQATSTLGCTIVGTPGEDLEITGIFVSKPLLDSLLAALGFDVFPANGLVLGKVIDELGNPVAGVVVTPSEGTVAYVSADLTGVTSGDGAATSPNGYFLTDDTPFDTTWEAAHPDGRTQIGSYRGGLVVNKVTTMVIQLDSLGVGG